VWPFSTGDCLIIRVSDKKIKSDSHETWKCADAELQQQFRYFPYGECSDVYSDFGGGKKKI
jgi:hypothetical protein